MTNNGVTCGAMRKNGLICKRTPAPGATKCYIHGGAAPQAKAKAEQMLALLRMPAIEVMHNVLESLSKVIDQFQEDTCQACGFPKGDAEEKDSLIRACRSAAISAAQILDRCGLGPRSTVELKSSEGDLDLKLLTDDERKRMMGLVGQLRSLKREIRDRQNGIAQSITATQPTQTM